MRAYCQDQSGQFAILFALIAMPIIAATAYVTDLTYAGKVKAELRASLDSAALASVIDQSLTESERAEFAKSHFKENFEFSDMFKIDVVSAQADRVELLAKGSFPSYIGAMTGHDRFELEESSASVLTEKDVICMMALDPTGEGAFSVSGNGGVVANGCSVQVNSTHKQAAKVKSGSSVVAESTCVAGGASGRYSPYVNTDCAQVADPYKDLKFTDERPCTYTARIRNNNARAAELADMQDGVSVGGDKAILSPGVYCEDVRIEGKDVIFLPGTYTFRDSKLWFRDGSEVHAENVTLVMSGTKSELRMDSESILYLKAPSEGPMAGLAIFQDTQSLGKKADKMSGKTRFKGDTTLAIVGTVYMPNHRIVIASGTTSDVKNKALPLSPATSFIAYQIHVDGANVQVAVDHQTAGLPAMLPRSDEGARLVE